MTRLTKTPRKYLDTLNAKRARLREAGLCLYNGCAGPCLPFRYCDFHRDRRRREERKYAAKRQKARKAEYWNNKTSGICTVHYCGGKALETSPLCAAHYVRHAAAYDARRAWQQRRKKAGLCTYSLSCLQPAAASSWKCEQHRQQHNRWKPRSNPPRVEQAAETHSSTAPAASE